MLVADILDRFAVFQLRRSDSRSASLPIIEKRFLDQLSVPAVLAEIDPKFPVFISIFFVFIESASFFPSLFSGRARKLSFGLPATNRRNCTADSSKQNLPHRKNACRCRQIPGQDRLKSSRDICQASADQWCHPHQEAKKTHPAKL